MTKILVVDDEEYDLNRMSAILQADGYSVTGVSNGAEAFDLVEADNFDLILLDILMPTLSGYDLMRLIKKQHSNRTKVAYVSIVPRKEVDAEGIDGFIQKPFNQETFISAVKGLLEKGNVK